MLVFWLIFSIYMGALLGANIALYEEYVRDWLGMHYWEWYRARHPLSVVDMARLTAKIDPTVFTAFASFGISAQEMSDAMRRIANNADGDYALDKQGFPLYTEASRN